MISREIVLVALAMLFGGTALGIAYRHEITEWFDQPPTKDFYVGYILGISTCAVIVAAIIIGL